MKKQTHYELLQAGVGYYTALIGIGLFILAGLGAAWYM